MKVSHAVAVLAVAVIAAAGCIILLEGYGEETWSIGYELDGGELAEDPPTEYASGEAVLLPVPVRYGYVFLGWTLEEGSAEYLTDTSGLSGDVTLYANWEEAPEYSIRYVLGGGSFTGEVQDSYYGGGYTFLPDPVREGYTFGGWYLDEDLTQPVVLIDPEFSGDLTVYACWVDEDLSGTGYLWSVSGTYYNGTVRHTMSGTLAREYVAYVDGEHYYTTIRDIEYSWEGGSTTVQSSTGSWTGGGTTTLHYVGLGEANGYSCTIWEAEDGTLYWLYNLSVQVRISLEQGTTSITYDLIDVYGFEPETSFTPSVYAEYPLTVIGSGTVEIGGTLTLTAYGEGFTGWYVNGTLASTGRTLRVTMMSPSLTITAVAGGSYTVIDPGSGLDGYGFGGDAVITDSSGNVVTSDLGSLDPGLYRVTEAVGDVTRYMDFFIDETRVFTHTWTYGGSEYSVEVVLLYSDVYRYDYENAYPFRVSLEDSGYVAHYHTVDDPTLIALVGTLKEMCPSDADLADFILYFVQTIDYISDDELYGTLEYWTFPLEYLWNGGGDCEDSVIFYDTLMIIAGYDVAMVVFSDHAMSAIAVEGTGYYVTIDGIRYYLCETTGTGEDSGNRFDIGETSAGHLPSDVWYSTKVEVRGPG